MTEGSSVAVFDLDGVLVASTTAKHRALMSIFDGYPHLNPALSEYFLVRGGVPRREKIAGALVDVIGVSVDEAVLSNYLTTYDVAVKHALLLAPLVPGVQEFVRSVAYPKYVCSSAPEAEVDEQLRRFALHSCFDGRYGGGTPKQQALREIAERHGYKHVVFFGDAVADHDAAIEAGIAFVAVTYERDAFGTRQVVRLRDFTNRAAVEESINTAFQSLRSSGTAHR